MMPRGSLGWILLALALAVPAVMFWNWWKALNPRVGAESSPKSGRSAIPWGASGRPAARPSAPSGTAAPVPAAPGGDVRQGPREGSTALPAAPGGSTRTARTPEAPAGALSAVAVSSAAEARPGYDPGTTRDPTLSPNDFKRLARMALERELDLQRKDAAAKAGRPGKPKTRREPPVETRIQVRGIVATAAGITAIVNDEIVKPGDWVHGARVLKITTSSVVFEYKKRTFVKAVPR